MVLSRISTYGQSSYNWANIAESQKRMSDLHTQVITGKKAQHASGIARDANLLFNLENQVYRNQRFEATIDIAQRRLTQMETNTKSILTRVGEFRKDLLRLANDPNQAELPLASMAKDFYNEIAGYLNTEQEQRFLFSGGRTDTQPVKDFDTMISDLRGLLTDSNTVAPFDSGISNFVPTGDVVGQPVAFLNTNALAEEGAVDPDTGLPIREMQVIDFFTNDATFGSLARSVTSNTEPDDLTGRITNELGGVGLPGGTGPSGAANSVNPIDFKRLYYQGDDTALSVTVEDNRTIEYGVTAEARGFELVLAAATILAMDDASPPIDLYNNNLPGATAGNTDSIDLETRIEAALKLFEDAIKDTGIDNVASIQSEMGVPDKQLQETKARLANFNLFYEGSISEIENTDVLEAGTLLAQNQLVLEQAFRSIGTLRNLSLANFIR